MGSSNSRNKEEKVQKTRTEEVNNNESREDGNVNGIGKFDKQIIDILKKDLSETPELFVLNNVLMNVMFFDNYKKLIDELSPRRYEHDEDFIAPDGILEEVNGNVRYRPLHGPKKHSSEPLVPKRIFVLNSSIKVINSTESEKVENIGKTTVRIEESQRKGYVRLREIHNRTPPSNSSTPIEISEPNSRSSTDSSDTLYGYSNMIDTKTPKPIEILRGLSRHEMSSLPKTCISYRKVKKTCVDLEDREEISEEDLLETVSYINSKAFMKHFESNLILDNVMTSLGFNEDQIYSSKVIPGKVFCDLTNGDGSTMPCEIIPSIMTRWPAEQTLAFSLKGDRLPRPGKRYIFPTAGMIGEIKNLNCTLVPRGYVKKRGERSDTDIEWELCFPQAERYLESYMSHAQMKSLLFLLTLHKSFIEPKTAQYGFLAEHIRSFMLWECESNYSEWPEHRLGTKLLNVIKNLIAQMEKAKPLIPDYVIEGRNVLENVPKKYIRLAQKIFCDILQSPLMYFISSLRNLRYTRCETFFPPLDFERLYQILTKDSMQLPLHRKAPREEKKKQKWYADNETRSRHLEELKNRKKFFDRKEEERNMKNIQDDANERRESIDSIDIDWVCDEQMDLFKKRSLLTFFINAFIDVAEKSIEISTQKQTLLFLKQATYLTIILKDECSAFEDDVNEYLKKIRDLESRCSNATKCDTTVSTESLVSENGIVTPPKPS
ncbi:hypothetical protein JTB14_010908 [Gonioctena quinquepunctata]|nr:hypothetical protein JTB14_010908 [Gonioctena quinquepunctata]